MNNFDNLSVKEQIHSFLDGKLSESETDKLWVQLLKNPDDLDYMETQATLRKMSVEGKPKSQPANVKELQPSVPAESRRNRIAAFTSYLVAASVLIIGITFTYNTLSGPDYTGLDAIAMIEYDTERSSEEITTQFENYLQSAISYSAEGNLSDALHELDAASNLELEEDAQKAELLMLAGTVHYNAENYREALQSFGQLTTLNYLDMLEYEKAIWYTANTQIQLGMNEDARENLEKVIELDGAFSRVAKNKLENYPSN